MDDEGRDVFIDFMRAISLLVVVCWHWVFTILLWKPDGPHATNPIGFTHGLFLVTWLFQVMPLFFFIGGHAHTVAWNRASSKSPTATLWGFAWRRIRQLLKPALVVLAIWIVLGIAVTVIYDVKWMAKFVILVVSPLWFLAVYTLLVVLFPFAHWLHQRFGALVIVWSIGLAGVVDVLRFSRHIQWVGWFNMILVWGVCHQLGFFYRDLRDKPRRWSAMFLWSGLFALFGLVASGLYPGSMVGVPGDKFSNMAPPTLCIVALVVFQAGVAMWIRPWVLERLQTRQRWKTVNEVVNRFSMPLYLFHSTGMALSRTVGYLILKRIGSPIPDKGWWATRPIAWVGPLLWTLPIIWLFGRTPLAKKRAQAAA